MLRLAKAFWDIALSRRSPAHLPASLFLLGLVATAVALLEVLGALLPPASSDRILTRVLLSVGLPLVFAWLVLAVTRHRQRFLQTGIALLGVGVLAGLVIYPLESLFDTIGVDKPAAMPIGFPITGGLRLVSPRVRQYLARGARFGNRHRYRGQRRLPIIIARCG